MSSCYGSSMRLQEGKQERFDFCMKPYELTEKNLNSVLSAARYAAGHMKKHLTLMPSKQSTEYVRLHKVYTLQVQDIRSLKALVWVGNTYGWAAVVSDGKKVLGNLPMTPANLRTVVDELLEKYGETQGTEVVSPESTPVSKAATVALTAEELREAGVQDGIDSLIEENSMRYADLQAQLGALREETSLDTMAVAHKEYKDKVEDLLSSVQQRKAEILVEYEQKMSQIMSQPVIGDYTAVAVQEQTRRDQIEALQHHCEKELAQAGAYEARIVKELGEVTTVSVGSGSVDQGMVAKKAEHVEFLAAALETQEKFVQSKLGDLQAQLDEMVQARDDEKAAALEASGLAASYSAQLDEERKATEEAKSAYVGEAYRTEKAEAEAVSLKEQNGVLEAMIKKLELELTTERSARAMAELRASAAGR